MFALPAFLSASILGDGPEGPQPVIQVVSWLTYGPSLVMYWLSGAGYARRMFLPREVLEAERDQAEEPSSATDD